jgi:hypothetical protein
VLEHREHGVIEPAAVAPLRVARHPFELEAQPADDVERRLVLGGWVAAATRTRWKPMVRKARSRQVPAASVM